MELLGQILEYFTYSPRDLLHFSARTYYRLFELQNRAVWPAQLAALAAGSALLWLVARPGGAWRSRAAAALLAAAWLFVAWSYLAGQLATVHLAGTHFAWAFAVQAALLLACAAALPGLAFAGAAVRRRTGAAIVAVAIFAYPLIAPLGGRPWAQAELFGIAPDATAAATLGVLAASTGRARSWLMQLPLAWCAVTGTTLWTLNAPAFWVMPALGAAAMSLSIARRDRRPA